jgi:hypothetical protein
VTATRKNPRTGGVSSMADVVEISMTRDQLGAYHRALHCAIDHAEQARGNHNKMNFVATLVELSDAAQVAIYKIDEIPQADWDPGVRERSLKRKARMRDRKISSNRNEHDHED